MTRSKRKPPRNWKARVSKCFLGIRRSSRWKTYLFRSLNRADRQSHYEEDSGPGNQGVAAVPARQAADPAGRTDAHRAHVAGWTHPIFAPPQRAAVGLRLRQHTAQPD